jgi:hypothetical protein
MVMLLMVSSFSSGAVLVGPRRPPPLVLLPSSRAILLANDPPPLLSLSSLWMASRANGSLPTNGGASTSLGLKHLNAQEMGGRTDPGMGQAHFGMVRSPLRARGSSCHYALCPLHLHHFDDVILASKMEGLLA